MCQHIRELLECQQLVVPRELVGTGNAGTSQVIVELMPDDALPRIGHHISWIAGSAQPVGHHCCTFSRITQVFVLTVIQFHDCLRSIAAVAMNVHRQLTVEYWQFRVLVVRQIIFVDLIAGSTHNLNRTATFDTFLDSTH